MEGPGSAGLERGWGALGSVLSVMGLLPGRSLEVIKWGHERAEGRRGAYTRTLRGPGLGTPGTHLPIQESREHAGLELTGQGKTGAGDARPREGPPKGSVLHRAGLRVSDTGTVPPSSPREPEAAAWDKNTVQRRGPRPQRRVGRQPAPAAVTVVVALLPGGLGSGGEDPRVLRPLGDPRLRDQGQHQTQVMSGKETGREESDLTGRAQPCGLSGEGEGSRGQDGPSEVQGPGEGSGGSPLGTAPRPAVVEAACTWAPPSPSGHREAAARRSAQDLVQVGRGEEHVGGQAHSQEAPDQGGPETTFKRERKTQSEGQRSEEGPVGGRVTVQQTTSPAPQGLPVQEDPCTWGSLGQVLPPQKSLIS